ncbi:MAG: tryptophan synthase subunit alpha [Rikenellaceae bacterium]|jgi:tryptophan synthase alpha chain|nr:tryptophan synthase subunit alpha [Rikenellaceae bacterium]
MNRIKELFARKPKGILSVYFTAGYPQKESTVQIIGELERQGVDMVEIGIPFSDPMADGPVIQQSSGAALAGGMTLAGLFDQLRDVRRDVKLPLVMMGYLNPVMQYGFERFCHDCADAGIDGLILPDLPFDEYVAEYKPVADRHNLSVIMLVTPETSTERIRLIDSHTDGFIYMVSAASTTGARESFDGATLEYMRRVADLGLRNPRLVGFGISNPATYAAAQAHADGAIVGSAFIRLLGSEPTVQKAVERLLEKLGK